MFVDKSRSEHSYHFAGILPKNHVIQYTLHFTARIAPFAFAEACKLCKLVLLPLSTLDRLAQENLTDLYEGGGVARFLEAFDYKQQATVRTRPLVARSHQLIIRYLLIPARATQSSVTSDFSNVIPNALFLQLSQVPRH